MPRYFFHTEDGSCFPDRHGTELPGLDAVRNFALRTMFEMSQALGGDFWRTGGLRITVKDEGGLTLLTLDVIATTSSAVPASPAAAPGPDKAANRPRGSETEVA